jgi:hypothetical protein
MMPMRTSRHTVWSGSHEQFPVPALNRLPQTVIHKTANRRLPDQPLLVHHYMPGRTGPQICQIHECTLSCHSHSACYLMSGVESPHRRTAHVSEGPTGCSVGTPPAASSRLPHHHPCCSAAYLNFTLYVHDMRNRTLNPSRTADTCPATTGAMRATPSAW